MPGYVSRYDDYDVDDFETPAYETHAPAAHAPINDPPIRRGPLRGHTQHSRGNQSVLRGPHVPPRRESSPEEIASEYHRRSESSGFGNGL
jgi:stage V sporulation protein G